MTGRALTEDNDDGFYGYIEDTHDPGYSLLFATILFCILSYCSLPFLLNIAARLDIKNVDATTTSKKKKAPKDKEEVREVADDDLSLYRAPPKPKVPPNSTKRHQPQHMQQRPCCPPSPDRSLISLQTNTAVSIAGASSIHSACSGTTSTSVAKTPRRRQRQARKRRMMEKRHIMEEYELRMKQYYSTTRVILEEDTPFDESPVKNKNPNNQTFHNNNVVTKDDGHDDDASLLGPLDFDAVSIEDAISTAGADIHPTKPIIQSHKYHHNKSHKNPPVETIQMTNTTAAAEEEEEELGGGRLFWNTLLDLITWDFESRRLVKLAIPFATQAFSTGILESLTVAIIGKLLGTREVAAFVTVRSMVGISSSFFGGFHESIATLGAQALGHKQYKLVGQYVQLSMILYVVCYIPFMVLWWVYMRDILVWFGFDEVTCDIGHDYTKVYLFLELMDGIDESIHALLDIQDLESYSTLVGVSHELVTFVDILLVALIADSVELWIVGIIELVVTVIFITINVSLISWNGWFSKYHEGLVGSCALYNKSAVKSMFTTGSSLAFGYLLTDGEWEILTFCASYLGPAEVAAWGILGTVWTTIEDLTEAVADAAEVRCAFLLGSGQPEKAKISAYKSICFGVFLSLFLSSIVLMLGEDLPTFFTNDPALQHIITDLIPLFALGNCTLTVGTICWTLLGSQGRYRLSTAVAFLASWLVTLPLAAVFTFVLRVNLQGQVAAVVIGYMVSGTINAYFLFRSDWNALCQSVLDANELENTPDRADGDASAAMNSSTNTTKKNNFPSFLNQALGTVLETQDNNTPGSTPEKDPPGRIVGEII